MRRHPPHRAFTLIELIIVIVVLGVLAALAVPNFRSTGDNAKAKVVETELAGLSRAVTALAKTRAPATVTSADLTSTVADLASTPAATVDTSPGAVSTGPRAYVAEAAANGTVARYAVQFRPGECGYAYAPTGRKAIIWLQKAPMCRADASTTAPALLFTSTITGCPGALNCYVYEYLSTTSPLYTVQAGDAIEYWLYLEPGSAKMGLDIHTSNGVNLRDGGGYDQNGRRTHPGVVPFESGRWQFRAAPLPASMVGATINYLNIVNEEDTNATYAARFADIVVRGSDGTVRKNFWSQGDPVPTLPRHFSSHAATSSLTLVPGGR